MPNMLLEMPIFIKHHTHPFILVLFQSRDEVRDQLAKLCQLMIPVVALQGQQPVVAVALQSRNEKIQLTISINISKEDMDT